MLLHANSEDSDQTVCTGHFAGFVMLWLILYTVITAGGFLSPLAKLTISVGTSKAN